MGDGWAIARRFDGVAVGTTLYQYAGEPLGPLDTTDEVNNMTGEQGSDGLFDRQPGVICRDGICYIRSGGSNGGINIGQGNLADNLEPYLNEVGDYQSVASSTLGTDQFGRDSPTLLIFDAPHLTDFFDENGLQRSFFEDGERLCFETELVSVSEDGQVLERFFKFGWTANTTVSAFDGARVGSVNYTGGFAHGTDPNVVVTQGSVSDITPIFPLGDVNQDGVVNFLDISAFVAVLSFQGFQVEADIDQNGVVNFLDTPSFIAILADN